MALVTWSTRWLLAATVGGFVAMPGLGSGLRADAQSGPALSFTSPLGGFQRPTHVTHAGDGSGRLFVAEQVGRIRIVRNGAVLPTPFLDIRGRVGEAVNGVAFPPGYVNTGHFYVQYQDDACDSIVARFRLTADPDVGDPGSEAVVLRVPSAGYCGHDGGAPVFGPDGYLYVSLGDGTPSGHPSNPAQDPGSLRGKMLRIDVEDASASPYAIPPTNPFAATAGAAPEIWALGLRNPWRFAFAPSGDLYIADVGQGRLEEVNVQAAGSPGGENYGWRIMEGSLCFGGSSCDPSGLTLPVAEYDHGHGCAVTGGVVHRGAEVALQGRYVYGDFCSGKIWGLERLAGTWTTVLLAESTLAIVSFGEAEDGTLFVADYAGGGLYRVVGTPPIPTDLAISQTATVSVASELTYTLRVVNQGSSTATGVVVTDTLPAGVSVQSMTSTAGTCTRDGSVVTCRLVSLAGGAADSIAIVVRPTITGTIANTASVVANEPDPDLENNATTQSVAVTSSKDLVIIDLAVSAATVQSGESVMVSHRVKNVGGVTVTETHTDRIYLSADPTLELGADVLLGQSRGHTSDLAPNANTNNTQAVIIPTATPPGAYYILVQADALEAVDEQEEGNNVTAIPLTVRAPPPVTKDLVITSVAPSSGSVVAGGGVAVSYTVKNVGTARVTETYTERTYLSATGMLDAGATVLGTSPGHVTDLKANASLAVKTSVTVPAGTTPGPYFILVQADALDAIAEVNESNNVGVATITVTAPPPSGKDLVIENLLLSRNSVSAGGSVTLRYRVANRGTVRVTETYIETLYLSRDAMRDPADVLLGTSVAHTIDIPANATYTYSRSITVPPGTPPGSYYILVQGDALAAVTELDEGNNTSAVPLVVTGS